MEKRDTIKNKHHGRKLAMSQDKPEHLMSSETEKKIMEACVAQGLRHLAMSQSTEDAFSQQEKLEYKHNSLLASSLLCFATEEEMLKDWQSIDWSLATQAPDLIAYSGNKTAILHAPLKWATLKTASHEPKIYDHLWEYETEEDNKYKEYFWIVQKMLIERMEPFGAFTTDHRISDIGVRNNEIFWSTLLELGKVSAMTPVTSKRYSWMGEMTLFDMALLYGRIGICHQMMDQLCPNKEQALKTLLSLCLARSNSRERENYHKIISTVVKKCLKLSPSLHEASPVPLQAFCGNMLRSQGSYQKSHTILADDETEDASFPIHLVILSSLFLSPNSDKSSPWKSLISSCQKSLLKCAESDQQRWLADLGRHLNPASLPHEYQESCLVQTLNLLSANVQNAFLSEAFKTELLSSSWNGEKISHKLPPLIRLAEKLPQATLSDECFMILVDYIQERLTKEPQATLEFSSNLLSLKRSFPNERFDDLMNFLSQGSEKAVLGVELLRNDIATHRQRGAQNTRKM